MVVILFYDFEVYKYDWSVAIIDTDTQPKQFIINNEQILIDFYNQHKKNIWIGYKSNGYDRYIFKKDCLRLYPNENND